MQDLESSKICIVFYPPQANFHSMSAKPAGSTTAPTNSFEIKSTQLPLVALLLKSDQWSDVSRDLLAQFGPGSENPDFFERDPVVLDFSLIAREAPFSTLNALLETLVQCRLLALAFRGEPASWTAALVQLGLVLAPMDAMRVKTSQPSAPPAPVEPAAAAQAPPPRELSVTGTMVVDRPLRSGQKVYARGADLIVLAMVNQGAEVVADGNIHVYAPLRGKAMAGARGNTNARIFSMCMEPELVSIAGVYRTSENPLAANVSGLPAQVRLSTDGQEKLLFEPIKS